MDQRESIGIYGAFWERKIVVDEIIVIDFLKTMLKIMFLFIAFKY